MYTKSSLIQKKIFFRFLIFFLFVSFGVSLSFVSFLKAQEEAEPPASAQTPAAQTPSVLATSDGDFPGISVEVTELKRTSGGTLTLKFAMINDSDKALSFGYDFGDEQKSVIDFNTIGGVHLIDAVGKKKYYVVRDTGGECVCSSDLKAVEPGSRANLWAKFPAPPDNTDKITIVIPHFIPMDDVSISK